MLARDTSHRKPVRPRHRAACLLPIAALQLAAACGHGADAIEEPVDDLAEPILAHSISWRTFSPTPTQSGGFTAGAAVCDGFNLQGTWIAVGRATGNNRFRWSVTERLLPATAWADLGTVTFGSKPACAPLDEFYQLPQSQHSYQKAIVGLRTSSNSSENNRYYIRLMKVPPSPGWDYEANRPLPSQPTTVLSWTKVSDDQFVSAPAVTAAAGWLVLVGRRSDGRFVMRMNQLNTSSASSPYSNSNWQAPFLLPALPSGWTAQGDPAIANMTDFFGDVIVATRAKNGNQHRLFWISYNGYSFSNWLQYSTVSGVSQSDPALAVHVNDWVTPLSVFFRGTDNKVYGASTFYGSNLPFAPLYVQNGSNADFSGAPAAAGSLSAWEGEHVVAVMKDGQYHWASPCPVQGGC